MNETGKRKVPDAPHGFISNRWNKYNALATALREMGRIEKTLFILDYISNESLRRRIQRGLNKGEAVNALAKAIFFGKRGELRERELQDQFTKSKCFKHPDKCYKHLEYHLPTEGD